MLRTLPKNLIHETLGRLRGSWASFSFHSIKEKQKQKRNKKHNNKKSTKYKTSWKNYIIKNSLLHLTLQELNLGDQNHKLTLYPFCHSLLGCHGMFSFKTQNRNMFLNYLGWLCLQTMIWIFYFLLIFLLTFFIFWSTPTSESNNDEWSHCFNGAQNFELMGSVGNSGASWPRVQPNLWSAMSQVPLLFGL